MMNLFHRIKSKLNSLFYQILLYFMILLIPIVLIGVVSYINSYTAQKRDFSNMILMDLQSSAKTVDIYLTAAQETSMSFLYDETVQEYLSPLPILSLEQKSELRKIPGIISRSQNIVSDFIDNLFVYSDDKIVYTSEGVEDFDLFFGSSYRYDKYSTQFWKDVLKTEKYIEILPPSNIGNSNTYMNKSIVPIITVSKVNGYNAALIINISSDTIQKTVKSNVSFPSTGFLVIDGKGNIIASSNEEYINLDIIKKISSHFGINTQKFGELDIFNHKMLLTYAKSEKYGWTYYSLTPINEFKKQSVGILRMTVISCIALVLIGVILSFIFSVKLFNPIKNIKDILVKQNEALNIIENGNFNKNELEFIGMGVSSLMDKNFAHKNRFKKISGEYLDNSFIQLIEGHYFEHEDILVKVIKDEIGFVKPYYLCCNVQINFTDKFYLEIQDTDRLNILDGLKRIVGALFEEYAMCYVVEYRNNLYVCIINIDEAYEKEQVAIAANKLIKCFEYDAEYCEIFIGMGKVYQGLQSIWNSNSDAMTAIENREKGIKHQIIDSEKLNIRNDAFYSFNDEKTIINCLKTGEIDNLINSVNGILQQNKHKDISYKYMGVLLSEMYTTGSRYAVETGLDIAQLMTEEEQNIIMGNIKCDFKKRSDILKEFFRRIIKSLEGRKGNKAGSLISMSIEYIDKNYSKDIFLENIAEEMGVSVNYISRAFKQKTGINITDYIGMVRIQKAKELLVSTRMNIDEISRQVGINSRTTFLRIFKKFEGTSPSSYREIHNK